MGNDPTLGNRSFATRYPLEEFQSREKPLIALDIDEDGC